MSKKSFLLSSLKMGVATLSSRVLGFIREIIFAQIFGASGLTDAFHIAFKIPNMLRDLFAEGAFSSAFVPIFTGTKKEGDDRARSLLFSMGLILLFSTICISVGIIIFAPELIALLTDELFTKDAKRFEVAVLLTRLMAPFLTFVSLAALCMGVLNTYKVFFGPAMAPATFNIVMIGSMIFLPKPLASYGYHPTVSLGVGVFVGGLIQFLIQIPMLAKQGLLKLEEVDIKSNEVKEILKRMSVGTVGVAATQINLLVTTFLATGTVVGAVSWLQYAFRLFQFPVGILGVSIGNSNLVHFSEAWKNGDKDEAVSCLQTSYITSLFTLIPAMALIFALAVDCVVISFQRGAFSSSDTEMVVMALKAYLIGLPFYGLYKVFSPSFYTLDKPKIPVFISTFAIIINIIFCMSLVDAYGFKILAYGTSLTMIFIIVTQSIVLVKLLGIGGSFFFPPRFFKVMLGGAACYYGTHVIRYEVIGSDVTGLIPTLTAFSCSAVAGALIYVLVMCVMGDYKLVRNFLKRK